MLNFIEKCENCHEIHFSGDSSYPFSAHCFKFDLYCFRVFCMKVEQQEDVHPECKEYREINEE